jgi:DNA-3-methyladenine glycosylase
MALDQRTRLSRDFFGQPTLVLARSLIGCRLVRSLQGIRLSGWIVETEAYLADGDPASHSAAGMKQKNRSMFLPAGHLYVYSIHTHHCLNVVSEPQGCGAAVLIRAIEPSEGTDQMTQLRGGCSPRDLTRGPGRLCQAMQVTRQLDGFDLSRGDQIWLESDPVHQAVLRSQAAERSQTKLLAHTTADDDPAWRIRCSGRIGIRQAADRPWRFFIDANRFVSGPASCHTRPPRDQLGRMPKPSN